jgi:hypothetical protein
LQTITPQYSLTILAGFILLFLVQNINVYGGTESTELPHVNDTNLQIEEYASGF